MRSERGFFGKTKRGLEGRIIVSDGGRGQRGRRVSGLVSEKEMGIMVGKGKSFRKSPIQEYGRGPHFACFVLPATNALPPPSVPRIYGSPSLPHSLFPTRPHFTYWACLGPIIYLLNLFFSFFPSNHYFVSPSS